MSGPLRNNFDLTVLANDQRLDLVEYLISLRPSSSAADLYKQFNKISVLLVASCGSKGYWRLGLLDLYMDVSPLQQETSHGV